MAARLIVAVVLALAVCGCGRREDREIARLEASLRDARHQVDAVQLELVSQGITMFAEEQAEHEAPWTILKGVHANGDGTLHIQRRAFDALFDNQGSLLRSLRILPEYVNGAVVGVRLLNMSPDSVLSVLGFKNEDRVDRIMGISLASTEQALEAYARLRRADHASFEVVRGTQRIFVRWTIE